MHPRSYNIKIFASLTAFLIAVLLLFSKGFPMLRVREEGRLAQILEQKKVVLELRQQQRNIELAREDLSELERKPYAPENLFSKDTTLVTQLRQWEDKAKQFNVEFVFSATGTVMTAPKAKTASELYIVPFSIQLRGEYADLVAYMDWLEHLATVLSVRSVILSGASETGVAATLAGSLYLRK